MRDSAVDTITFTNADGETISVKEMREFISFTAKGKYNPKVGDSLDLIAVQTYGDDQESQDYKIYDQNVRKIVEADFNLDKIRELEIPN